MDKIQIAKRIRESIKSGQLNTLRDLLEREPKMLEYVTPFGTWLHVATAHGHLEIIEYLVVLSQFRDRYSCKGWYFFYKCP